MKGNGERINVAEALRLMIKQIAAPLQILSGAEVLLRARHAVVSSINYHGVEGSFNASSCLPQWNMCKTMHTFKQPSKLTIKVHRRFSLKLISSVTKNRSHLCMSVHFWYQQKCVCSKQYQVPEVYTLVYLFFDQTVPALIQNFTLFCLGTCLNLENIERLRLNWFFCRVCSQWTD